MSQTSYALECSFRCVNHVFQALRALEYLNGSAIVSIFDEGVKFSARVPSNTCEAHVFLTRDLFSSYSVGRGPESPASQELDPESFEVNIKALTSCLQIVGSSKNDGYRQMDKHSRKLRADPTYVSDQPIGGTSCYWLYEGSGSPFVLYFSEGKHTTTRCNLKTRLPLWDDMYIPLNVEEISQKVIMSGSALDNAMAEFESLKPNSITIGSTATDRSFTFTAEDDNLMGLSYTFSRDPAVISSHSMRNYASRTTRSVAFKYNFDALVCAREAIRLASSVSLRCDSAGFMSIQCKCKLSADHETPIDFRFRPYEEEYDVSEAETEAESSGEESDGEVSRQGQYMEPPSQTSVEDDSQSLFIQ